MKTRIGYATVLGLALAMVICAAAPAGAVTFVGTCAAFAFPTIQQGVNAATAGSTVKICPGIYPEQVEIKKNLVLEGFTLGTANQVVVAAPAGGVVANTVSLSSGNPIAAQIWVHDAASVSISDVVVDGSNNGISTTSCTVPNLIGIYYQDASGIVNHVVTRGQTAVPANGCQWGLGIFVQSGTSLLTSMAGTSTVSVLNNSVHDYQKNGITGNEAGTVLTVTGNQVRGQGPTSGAAENGIQLGFGASGKITTNTVIDDIFTGCVSPSDCAAGSAAGILVFDVANATVTSNHVGNSQVGIGVADDGGSSADNQTITSNTIDGTLVFDGIDLCGSNGGTISSNTVFGSTESAIHLDSTCTTIGGPAGGGATVKSNILNEGCAGILNGTAGNVLTGTPVNTFYNVANTTLTGDTCTPPSDFSAPGAPSGSGDVRPHAERF